MSTTLLPQASFTDTEEQLFRDLDDDAELDSILDALFPESLTGGSPRAPARS